MQTWLGTATAARQYLVVERDRDCLAVLARRVRYGFTRCGTYPRRGDAIQVVIFYILGERRDRVMGTGDTAETERERETSEGRRESTSMYIRAISENE